MSNGGAFRLLSNDGKQDDMIMATRYLNSRLQKIQSLRSRDPRIKDPTPSLGDIEKTHILFVRPAYCETIFERPHPWVVLTEDMYLAVCHQRIETIRSGTA